MKRAACVVLAWILSCGHGLAQSAQILTKEIHDVATAPTDDNVEAIVQAAIKARLASDGKQAGKPNAEFLAFRRADVQSGGSSGASGTTSAVSNPLLPAIFGIAFEDGALTRTVSGTTITIKVSPAGLVCANGPTAAAVAARDPDSCRTFWNRVGVTASFDTSRGAKSDQLGNLQTIDSEFSELGVRAEVLNRRRPAPYRAFLEKAGIFAELLTDSAIQNAAWLQKVRNQLNALVADPNWLAHSTDRRGERVADTLDALLPEAIVPPGSSAAWLAALRADERSDFNRAVVTAEYSFLRPDLTAEALGADPIIVPAGIRPPNVHTARVIYAQGLGDRNIDFTVNASGSWFDEVRTGMPGHFRDFRTGVQGTFKMRDIVNYGAPSLTFAGLYVFLNQEPLGLGITAFNDAQIKQRGHIFLFQTKVEFPTANNAIRIPLSFSASNRTELIDESDVRGQIGISFNLDALFVQPPPK